MNIIPQIFNIVNTMFNNINSMAYFIESPSKRLSEWKLAFHSQ